MLDLRDAGFVAFDTYKTLLQDEMGKISGPRTVIAGFGAGITESLLAVTPFESIKTTLWVASTTDSLNRVEVNGDALVQNRRPQIGEPTHARFSSRLIHHLAGTRLQRLLSRLCPYDSAAGCQLCNPIWQLHYDQAIRTGICCSGREARNHEHFWYRWSRGVDHGVCVLAVLKDE